MEVGLAPHPETLHELCRRVIATVTPTENAMQSEALESEAQHLARCFASVPLALVIWMQHEADLALLVLRADPAQADISNHDAGVTPLRRQDQAIPLLLKRLLTRSLCRDVLRLRA
jgi:hypothetical protein